VVLPWTAVYAAMVEGEQRGTVWPEDVPEDVLTGSGEAAGPAPASAPPTAVPGPPVVVKDEEPRKRGHLKLVE